MLIVLTLTFGAISITFILAKTALQVTKMITEAIRPSDNGSAAHDQLLEKTKAVANAAGVGAVTGAVGVLKRTAFWNLFKPNNARFWY